MSQAVNLHYDYLFKVVLVGDEEPTKTGLLWAFTGSNNIISDYKLTIGVNFGISSVFLEDTTLKLQIWDVSYDPRVKLLRHLYFKGLSGCIMVIKSLDDANNYLSELNAHTDKPIPVLFILLTDAANQSEINSVRTQLNAEVVTSGYQGIEWLADAMLSYQRTKIAPGSAVYAITQDEIEETLQELSQAQIRNELERMEKMREKRAIQLELIKEVLEDLDIPVEGDTVRILSSKILFTVNIITGNVNAYPLKCDNCRRTCKKPKNICIIRASDGYSDDLDNQSLLIISKIYAIVNNELPEHVRNQIKNILRCTTYKPK